MESIGALLRERAKSHPDAVLLRCGSKSVTYADADVTTDSLAHGLLARGVRPGDRVMLVLGNGVQFPLIWLAIAKAAAVVVPVNPASGTHDLAHVLTDCQPSLIVSDRSVPAEVEVVAPADLADAPPVELPRVTRDTLMSLQYTSGTTGLPKGCMLTHDYWLSLADLAARMGGITSDDVLLTAQPCFYIDPQWNLVLGIRSAAQLCILPKFSPSTFWDSVVAAGATFCYLVGAMPVFLLNQPESPEVERGHQLRMVICSGIPRDVHAELERRYGVAWREAYGSTETGVDLVVPVDAVECVGTGWLGEPVPGKEVRVDNGELMLRGRPMMSGYWNHPSPFDDEAWLRTGDLVTRDRAGRLTLVGRTKDMVRRAGENIAAAEVENVLCEHPDIEAAAVVGVPDALRGEEVKAYVQPFEGRCPDPADIIEFTRERLASFKVPRFIELVPALPRTPSERVAKHQLTGDPERTYDAKAAVAQ